jgi:signal peptidase I
VNVDVRMLITDLIVDLTKRGHSVRFQVRGQSMHPLIQSDDYLTVEPADPAAIVHGDVILADAERGLTAHRVVRIARTASGELLLTTRGDNLPESDPPLRASQLLGRVTRAERNGRSFIVGRIHQLLLPLRRLRVPRAFSVQRVLGKILERGR